MIVGDMKNTQQVSIDQLSRQILREQAAAQMKEARALEDARADAHGIWALAEFYLPPSVKEMAQLWGMRETLAEMWRSAFIEGWRAAHRKGKPATLPVYANVVLTEENDRLIDEIKLLRAALNNIAKDDPSGKWGRWAREALAHEQDANK